MKIWLLLFGWMCAAAGPVMAENYLILPFFNLSGEANLQWIGESVAENIRDSLAAEGVIALDRETREEGYHRLSVRPSTQLTKATILRLGEVLDADQIIYGSFTYSEPAAAEPKTKGTLRIIAQVVNLKKARQGPEFSEIGALEDLARLQNHLAWQTLQYVSPRSAPSEEEFRARRPVVRVDAIESYVRGLLASVPDQKLKLLLQAVRLDPKFSQASFQLGKLLFDRKSWRPASEHLERVPLPIHIIVRHSSISACVDTVSASFQEPQTHFAPLPKRCR